MSAWAVAHAPPEEKQRRAEELMRKARERREEEIRAELRASIAQHVAALGCPRQCQGAFVERGHLVWCPERVAARIAAGEFG